MTPLEFIKDRVGAIALKFPHIVFKYGKDTVIDCHIIEMTPLNEYETNKLLLASWIPIYIEFNEAFEYESISFVSDDSSLKVEDCILSFNEIHEMTIADIWDEILNTKMSVWFNETVTFQLPIKPILSYSNTLIKHSYTTNQANPTNSQNVNGMECKDIFVINSNSNYSMAA